MKLAGPYPEVGEPVSCVSPELMAWTWSLLFQKDAPG